VRVSCAADPAVRPAHGKTRLWKNRLLLQYCFWRVFFFTIYSLEMMAMRTATGGVLGPHYSSSKAALHGLMHWVARQYSKKGIVSVTIVTIPSFSCRVGLPCRLAMPLPRL
jgi:NAD(P)-dependent dehydrogenase (short-subunit alcohol dehydrogenase family)